MVKIELGRMMLVYCFIRLEDGSYIALNRDYKPIGFRTRDHLTYEDYPIRFRFKGIGLKNMVKLSTFSAERKVDDDCPVPACIFLWTGIAPWSTKEAMEKYLARLAKVSRYIVQVEE